MEAAGHTAIAPDLPGMGQDRTAFADDVLRQWTDAIASVVECRGERVVLVGHSAGAAVASAVAERHPDRVALVAYLAGFLAPPGGTIADLMARAPDVASAFVQGVDDLSIGIDPARAIDMFYGLCTRDAAARAAARLTASPLQPSMARLKLSSGRFGRVPLAYIETSEDRALPVAIQREAQARWPIWHVVTLPSDHSPFYSMPQRLAAALDDLARASASDSEVLGTEAD